MRHFAIIIILFLSNCYNGLLHATSLVYNLRIRRSFVPAGFKPSDKRRKPWTLTAVPSTGARKTIVTPTIGEHRSYEGSVFNLRYRFNKNWALEGATAIAREKLFFKTAATKICEKGAGFDDVVLTAYYTFFPQQKTQFIVHMLGGFPTSRKIQATDPLDRILGIHTKLVGTQLYSLGMGAELSHDFFASLKSSLTGVLQARAIHFFSRELPMNIFKDTRAHPGNVIDLFGAFHYRYKRHNFEAGLNPAFFTNARIDVGCAVTKIPYVLRHSVYGTYNYIIRQRGAVGTGASGIFIRKPVTMNGFLFWINGTILF